MTVLGAATQSWQLVKRYDKGVLGCIFGVVAISEHIQGNSEYRSLVALHQLSISTVVAPLYLGN